MVSSFRARISKICALLVLFSSLLFALVPLSVHAQGLKGQACEAAGTVKVTNCTTGDSDGATSARAGSIAKSIVNTLSIIVGLASVVMIIIGGLRYVISNGDSSGLQGAKNSIIYALVGLVVVLFAQVIVRFVLTTAQGPSEPNRTINGAQ